ncbi:hypothetical protein Dsin_013196 [Dipteronia sinensis]|uniref:Reverse transcriptase zinc-binding domain-containing protein n=1 Tax=Dipteronia sinensis TaxID=43782 RepID=A0AAE0AJP5_9ROSI|nr:hypothetical protein Dsin_013196 [Dipteronia sinensis]
MQVVLGCGDRIRFWHDLRHDGILLSVCFPRNFALATAKEGTVQDFGVWQHSRWMWNRIDSIVADFSVSSNLLWKGLCPPKVEIFSWQLWTGRILVRDVLLHFGMTQGMPSNCPMCNSGTETIDHLFIHCQWSWKAKGKPGSAGIGGVLRNSNGKTICLFSLSVDIQDSNATEILAILKACELCTSNHTLANCNIQIASDSMVAVSWANSKEDLGSILHLGTISDIRGHLQNIKGLSIIFNPRVSNKVAESLAKLSSNGAADIVEWWEG